MAILERIRISVRRTINLGNYSSVQIEASADVGRDSDADTPATMRNLALNEAASALELAYDEFVPKPASREKDGR